MCVCVCVCVCVCMVDALVIFEDGVVHALNGGGAVVNFHSEARADEVFRVF